MRRSSERLIDVAVLGMLLAFAWLMRDAQPGLAGVVIAASINFWLSKNATAPAEPSEVEATARAAAAVLAVARAEQHDRETARTAEVVAEQAEDRARARERDAG